MKKALILLVAAFCLLLMATNGRTPAAQVSAADELPAVYTDVKDFGAKGDGLTDDTQAIQNAINRLKNTGGTLLFPNGTYVINGCLNTYDNIILECSNSVLDCSKNIAPRTFLTVNAAETPTTPQGTMNPVLRNATVRGNIGFIPIPVSYTPGLTGIAFKTSQVNVEHCTFMGFDKTTEFHSDSNRITFDSCTFGYNNYGLYFDGTSKTHLGEMILFRNTSIGNNNYGIYNNLGFLTFEHCSIDYNNINHIAFNNAGLVLNDCHIESALSYNPISNPRIINQGRMIIKGGDIWDGDGVKSPIIFDNSGQIVMDNVMFRVAETGYIAKGSGTITLGKLMSLQNISAIRLLPALSGVRNGDFETGDLSGWKVVQGVGASVTNTLANNGTKSLFVPGNNFLASTSVLSQKSLLPQGVTSGLASFYAYNASLTNAAVHLLILDIDGNTISDVFAGIGPNLAFSRYVALSKIPQGAVYYQLRIDVGPGLVGGCYFDDFYMKFE